jgi:hypothetical protein
MPELTKAEAIRRAYLDPIRTVILVDDEFPTYDRVPLGISPLGTANVSGPTSLVDVQSTNDIVTDIGERHESAASENTSTGPKIDYERACALWGACRNLGYLCDIDDGARIPAGVPPHIEKSDLVVLDYHLQGRDPTLALKVLKHLSTTDHTSLVVVYTRDVNLKEVRRSVVAHLRGARRPDSFLSPEDLDSWYGLEEWDPSISDAVIDAFLIGDIKQWKSDAKLRQELTDLKVDRNKHGVLIEAAIETFLLEDRFRARAVDTESMPRMSTNSSDSAHIWAYTENLFVAFVQKTPENSSEGALVFDALRGAIEDWNPPYLPMVLSYARGAIARGGFRSEAITLSNPLLQAGWLYHAVAGHDEERSDRLRGLFIRLLSHHSELLLSDIAEFGTAHFPDCRATGIEALKWAKLQVPESAGSDEWQIMHHLNEFLALELHRSFVKTGTVFMSSAPAAEESGYVWVCVTPECDLIPRSPQEGTWQHTLHPIRPMLALRGRLLPCGGKMLKTATHFHHIFLTIEGELQAVKVFDPTDPNAKLEMFLLGDLGRILNDRFNADRLMKAEDGTVHSSSVPFRVIGQLRVAYASRLLQQAGYHLSRIAYDFENLP